MEEVIKIKDPFRHAQHCCADGCAVPGAHDAFPSTSLPFGPSPCLSVPVLACTVLPRPISSASRHRPPSCTPRRTPARWNGNSRPQTCGGMPSRRLRTAASSTAEQYKVWISVQCRVGAEHLYKTDVKTSANGGFKKPWKGKRLSECRLGVAVWWPHTAHCCQTRK